MQKLSRKKLRRILILSPAMILSFTVAFSLSVFADECSVAAFVAAGETLETDDLAYALSNADKGSEIVLLKDFEVSGNTYFTVGKPLTINLNGHNITANERTNAYPVFLVPAGVSGVEFRDDSAGTKIQPGRNRSRKNKNIPSPIGEKIFVFKISHPPNLRYSYTFTIT